MLLETNRLPKLASYKECSGCFACVDICPQTAISTYINEEGHYDICVDGNKCISCGKCVKVCKRARSDYGNNNLRLSSVYAGYANNHEMRRNATSGGIFSAVASRILHNEGVVVGVSFDGKYAKHVLIEGKDELTKLQGSKYTPSSMEGIYKKIEKVLPYKKVLFAGVGCQVSAILAFFENSPFRDNLYSIDLICGGVPSIALIEKFNEYYNRNFQIIAFRNKEKYELRVVDHRGKEKIIPHKNLPLDGFSYEMTNRYSCYDCKFAFCHRKSDITIGDMWDNCILPTEHNNGLSTIISHNQRGKQLLQESDIVIVPCTWEMTLKSNRRIACGKSHIYNPRVNLKRNIESYDYDTMKKIYCQEASFFDGALFIQKIYRSLRYKIEKKRDLNRIERLLINELRKANRYEG